MPDDDLTPTDEQVRRLLADARHTEPMPDDVVARLDDVLTGLREEPAAPPPATVHDYGAAARRRRTVQNWLLAAAAVVVVGVGITQVNWGGMSADDAGGDSASSSDSMAEDAPGAAEAPTAASSDSELARWRGPRLELTSEAFGKEIEGFRDGKERSQALAGVPVDGIESGSESYDYSPMCDVGALGAGYVVPVRYDGERAWLVFRKPQGDSQVVDLYLCGTDRPTRSITLPAP